MVAQGGGCEVRNPCAHDEDGRGDIYTFILLPPNLFAHAHPVRLAAAARRRQDLLLRPPNEQQPLGFYATLASVPT